MKKGKEIFTIIAILVFIFGVGVLVAINGIKAHDNHYVRIEVNPKVEFITNAKNKVVSVFPINEEAKTLLVEENLIDMNVSDACLKFVELCTMANFIDVDGEKNAVRLTVISGLTQSLENNVYSKLNKYFLNNEIKCVIVESDNDIDLISSALNQNVSSANKLVLINSIIEKDENEKLEDLKSLNETKLIDKLAEIHKSENYSGNAYSVSEITNKTKLIDFNREKYENHVNKVTDKSVAEFSEDYKEFKAEKLNGYEENFEEQYNLWRNSIN